MLIADKQMKIPAIIANTLAVFVMLSAQEIVWLKRFDTGRFDSWASGAIDSWGNVIVAGVAADDYSGLNADIILIKYNPDGETLWTRTYDSGEWEYVRDCAVGNDGGVVVVGAYSPSDDCFIMKYNRNGDLLWLKKDTTGCDSSIHNFTSVLIDDSLNIYVTGIISHFHNGQHDNILLRKYDFNGNLLLRKEIDFGNNMEDIAWLIFTPDGNIAGAGEIGDWDYWYFDLFAAKFTRGWDTIWTRRLDVKNEDFGGGIAVDPAGNIYCAADVAQYFGNFVPDSCVTYSYSPDGELTWFRIFSDGDLAGGTCILLDNTGNLLVGGFTMDTLPVSRCGALLLCYKTDGTLRWNWQFKLQDSDCYLLDIVGNEPGIIYGIGEIYQSPDSCDLMVMKLHYPVGLETQEFAAGPNSVNMCNSTLLVGNKPLSFTVTQPADYRIVLYDLTGREVERLYQGQLGIGEYRLPIRTNLRNGVYLVRIEAGGEVQTGKVILVR